MVAAVGFEPTLFLKLASVLRVLPDILMPVLC